MRENALGKSEADGEELSGGVGSQSDQDLDGLVGIRQSFRGRVLTGAWRDYEYDIVRGPSDVGLRASWPGCRGEHFQNRKNFVPERVELHKCTR